jgi:hypothetical protein
VNEQNLKESRNNLVEVLKRFKKAMPKEVQTNPLPVISSMGAVNNTNHQVLNNTNVKPVPHETEVISVVSLKSNIESSLNNTLGEKNYDLTQTIDKDSQKVTEFTVKHNNVTVKVSNPESDPGRSTISLLADSNDDVTVKAKVLIAALIANNGPLDQMKGIVIKLVNCPPSLEKAIKSEATSKGIENNIQNIESPNTQADKGASKLSQLTEFPAHDQLNSI